MFISTDYLTIYYGVDERIARFFVDRDPPADNLYWHGKLLYLRPAVGYLFIPLAVDLLYKLGLDKDALLGNEFVQTMEQTGHISAMEETNQITAAAATQQCADLVKDNCKDPLWYHEVLAYLQGGSNYISAQATPFKALHRGDVFLFSLCALHFPQEKKQQIVNLWFALISTLLLMDDADDAKEDMRTGDENAFLEHGLSEANIALARDLVLKNVASIASLNETMAKKLHRKFEEVIQKPITLLNTI